MAKRKQWTRWAILSDHGLYTGQYLTRRDAIADHVWHLRDGLSRFAPLDKSQIEAWQHCQKKGDRAVKVLIRLVGRQHNG